MIPRLTVVGAIAMIVPVALGGCSETRQALGLEKSAPDEFAVLTRAPLSVPPEFGLRPPTPGAPRPQELSVSEEARQSLLQATGKKPMTIKEREAYNAERRSQTAQLSSGEKAIAGELGATKADPTIRQVVDAESSQRSGSSKYLIDYILFWREPTPTGDQVDPVQERQRLQQNTALGRPVTEGPTPTIKRRSRGLLNDLLGI